VVAVLQLKELEEGGSVVAILRLFVEPLLADNNLPAPARWPKYERACAAG
jgi:hypothetical protein